MAGRGSTSGASQEERREIGSESGFRQTEVQQEEPLGQIREERVEFKSVAGRSSTGEASHVVRRRGGKERESQQLDAWQAEVQQEKRLRQSEERLEARVEVKWVFNMFNT